MLSIDASYVATKGLKIYSLSCFFSFIKVPNIYVPEKLVYTVRKYILSAVELSGNVLEGEKIEYEKNMELVGVKSGDTFLINKNAIRVRVFEMDHSVSCVGFGFSKVRSKLKEQYKGLKGSDIANLRKEGVEISEELEERVFVFCGDTTHLLFEKVKDILLYPIVVVECSFIREEEEEKAKESKHMLWKNLKPIILANPKTIFVLIHFSMRYSKAEIKEFFQKESLENVHIMLQEEDDEYGSTFGLQNF